MFYIYWSFIKRKTWGEDLERDGLKTGDARPGLGFALGCPVPWLRICGQFGP